MLREIELSLARLHHLPLSCGPTGLVEVTWLLPASKTDPAAVGVSRSHGCSCGGCRFGFPDHSLDSSSPDDPLGLSLCPTRAAARQVLHSSELRDLWAADAAAHGDLDFEDFPLFPSLEGRMLDKADVVSTTGKAMIQLGLPTCDADGVALYGGHSMRVGGAQGLSRAGIEAIAIALLARWGSSAVFGYIRDAPLERSNLVAGQAVLGWQGGVPREVTPRPRAPRGWSSSDHPVATEPTPSAPHLGASAEALRALEARVAALEAQAWARDEAAVVAWEAFRERVSAACQAVPPEVGVLGPLVRNCAASRVGVIGRFSVTHLVVPRALQPAGDIPRAFCGMSLATVGATLSFDGSLLDTEVCEKCLPGLATRISRRRTARAREVAASLEPPLP